MIRWLLRLTVRLGLRWMVLSALVRWLVDRFGRRRVEEAAEELEDVARRRLPAPVARAVEALPPEAKTAGGSALVAGRAARGAVVTSHRAARVAGRTSRQVAGVPGVARDLVDRVRDETEASRRRLRHQYLAETVGPEAATDALLSVRTEPPPAPMGTWFEEGSEGAGHGWPDDPHDAVPGPVAPGRRRFRPRPPRLVKRMRRSYRPDPSPWDEPGGDSSHR